MKKFKLAFFLVIFSFAFCQNVFADETGDESETTSESDGASSDESSSGSSAASEDDGSFTVYDDDGNVVDSVNYDDVYNEAGIGIYSNDDKDVEDQVYDHFYDEMISRTNSSGEIFASLYLEAFKALDEALKCGAEEEIAAAQAAFDDAKEALDRYCEHFNYTYEETDSFIGIYNSEHKTVATAGDPVIISLGKFSIDDCDIAISNRRPLFFLKRNYVSNGTEYNENNDFSEKRSGAFGTLWTSNLDTRIIRGFNFSAGEIIENLKIYGEKLSEAEKLISDCASVDSECSPLLEEIRLKIAENETEMAFYENEAQECEIAKEFNNFVSYGKPSTFNGKLSSNILIFCNDNGSVISFEKSESGIYLPSSSFLKNKISIEKLPIDSAESSEEVLEKIQCEEFCVNFINLGEKRFYSSYGLPLRFEYGNGESILFKYDENLLLSKVILDSAHYLDFSWSDGLLSSVSDGFRRVSYKYDGKNLVSVTDFENDTKAFEYDDGGFLKKQIKADGSFISFEYEDKKNEKVVSAVVDESGNAEHFSYDFENKKTVYTDSDGIPAVYFYDDKNRTVKANYSDGSEENWSFDENGNRISWNNGKVFANYKYDDFGRITEKNDEFGATELFSYSENHLVSHKNKFGVTEDYSYDDEGNLSAVYIDGSLLKSFSYRGGLVEKETDCRGNTFFYYYDEKSNLSEVKILENGKSSQALLESYEYDAQNRVAKYIGADGITKIFTYADHKIIVECSNSVRITKLFSKRKLLLSEEIEDLLTGEKVKKEYEYDKNRRCRAVYISGKNSEKAETKRFLLCEYNYTSAGKISREIIWNLESNPQTEKSGTEKSYFYDSTGNLCGIKKGKISGDSSSSSENEKIITLNSHQTQFGNLVTEICGRAEKSFAYDFRGNLLNEKICGTEVSSMEYSSSGMLVSEKNGAYGGRTYEYGAFGFLSSADEENSAKTKSSVVSYFPDGKIKEAVAADGTQFFYEYNGLGMLACVFSKFKRTEYEYDLCGKLILKRIKDGNNRLIYEESWIYSDSGRKVFHKIGGKIVEKLVRNGFGLLKSKSDSVENSWIYSHDLLGRKIGETNPYGKTTKFTWDENNLLEKIIFPDGSFKRFFYDLDLNLIKAEDCAGKIAEYEYDDLSRLVSAWERPAAAPEKYEYDDFGRVTKVTQAGKILLENSYDDSKRQTVRKDAEGNLSFWNFDGAGRLLSSRNRNGNNFENAWNPDGRIKSSVNFNGTKVFYEYDSANLRSSADYSSGEKFVSAFDTAGNLISAENENCSLLFEYDSAGNLVYQKESGTGAETYFEYENGKISLISCGSRKIFYNYGKCGEILKIIDKPGTENSSQSLEISFEYDSCGREVSRKWSTGESMRIFYDEAGREILRTGFSSSHGLVFAEGAVYDADGFKILVLESDFTVKRYEYDGLGRVKSVSYPYSEEKARYLKSLIEGANLYSLEGNENFVCESISALEYEKLRKLCDLAGVSGLSSGMRKSIKESFEYDMNSNLVKRKTPFGSISYSYDKNDRLVSWGNGCSASYDANGNMISINNGRKIVEMEYNASNRLEKIVIKDFENDEQISAAYKYDALGRRIESCEKNGATRISYIGKTQTELFSVFTPLGESLAVASPARSRTGNMQPFSRIRYRFDGKTDSFSALDSSDSFSSEIHEEKQEYFTSKSAPLFSADGEILSLSTETYDSSGIQLSFMTGNTGTVKSFTDASDILSLLEYDEFGFPLSAQKSSYGFSGKRFDSKTELYNFGCRDYSPAFGRFSSEDPVLDGRNWYTYCAGDYVNFFDPDGLTMAKTEEQYMQDMKEALLGNSSYEKAKDQGCVVTTVAETLTALTGFQIDNSFINSDKSNFIENGGDISWSKIEENYGLKHTAVAVDNLKSISDETSGFYGLSTQNASSVWNCDTQAAMSVANYIAGVMESSKETVVSLRVVYGLEKNEQGKDIELLHFVVANGNVEMINGKSYVNITPTSRSDKYADTNRYRSAVGWIVHDGKTYVPVDNIRRIDTLSKGD